MTTYSYSNISAAQALAIGSGDNVVIDWGGSGAQASVAYDSTSGTPGISIGMGTLAVKFGPALSAISAAGHLTMADGSILFVGDNVVGDGPFTAGATNDGLFGGGGADSMNGGGGGDVLQGNVGGDLLTGGLGSDTIYGGADNDTIIVGVSLGSDDAANFANGNRGSDTLSGGQMNDTMLGGQDNDSLGGGGGSDFLNGNLGDDVIVSGAGDSRIYGEDGNDTITAGAGNNTIDGGAGSDKITLSGGANVVNGADGSDTIVGATGTDTITGGGGVDVMSGGGGADVFNINVGDATVSLTSLLSSLDRITDWGADDKLHFNFSGLTSGIAGSGSNFQEIGGGLLGGVLTTLLSALGQVNTLIGNGIFDYVAAQIGGDVVVFADSNNDNGGADSAVILTGKLLSDIDFHSLV